jgi:hypothetical protein
MNVSTWGNAAAMPLASGSYPGVAFKGLTHTTRWATRDSRAICSPITSGSPRSHPSERITTTAPGPSLAPPIRR